LIDGQIKLAVKKTGINQTAIGGGVSANGIQKSRRRTKMLENICLKI
jgi:tRNA A37 threonylcarbamoyltransferase TsaD